MGVIARRLQDQGEEWRHVYKSLLLLEYMSKHGPQKVGLMPCLIPHALLLCCHLMMLCQQLHLMSGLLHETVLAGLVGCRSTEMSLQVVEEIVSNVGVIEKLANFQHKDANGKDWGLNVRQRAKELVALVTDTERVRSERAKVWSCCHDPFSPHEGLMNAGSHETMHPREQPHLLFSHPCAAERSRTLQH